MKRAVFSILMLCAGILPAAEYFVDFNAAQNGDGSRGKPFRTFQLKQLKPGDRLTVLPSAVPIRRNLYLKDVQGTADRPIVIDGGMNVFCGTAPLDRSKWESRGNGRFVCRRPYLSNLVNRYFMVIGGRIVRMGRYNKGGPIPFRAPDSLRPGEWTAVRISRDSKDKRKGTYEFHLQLDPETADPAQAGAEEPQPERISGVMVFGGCRHVVIRNFIVRHFLNDGCNIHQHNENVKFENIAAVECGDDGISAHEDSTLEVENFVSLGNSTGICHINRAVSVHRNVYAEGNLGYDLLFTQQTVNTFENLFIRMSSARGIVVKNQAGEFRLSGGFWICGKKKTVISFAAVPGVRCEFRDSAVSGFGGKLPPGIRSAPENDPETAARVAAAREKLFALFGGRLEQLWDPDRKPETPPAR
ncbi:MAG: right-handed parallel beta-helix repeat-containing protein [Lentisphaeria bacterium]|nr:right-handed parallel beta-helix repeat-containing protein [Lentisphaeria bacterium]